MSRSDNGSSALHRRRLPNGLRVWIQPRPDSDSVVAFVVIRAGSRYETHANNGVSHFVEHMLFTGTQRWDEAEIKNVIRRRGGRWNGLTGSEATTYYAHVSASDLDIALDWLAEVVFRPTFPTDKVDKERGVIFQERSGRYGRLVNLLDRLGFGYELDRDVRRALFPGSTLGLRIVGEDDSLDSLDHAELLSYYHAHYMPDNAVLIVVGNVDPDQAIERAETYFGGLDRKVPPALLDLPPLPAHGPHQVVVRGPMVTERTRLMTGARTVGRAHPDRWPFEVLSEILSKDLQKEIRYQQGLVYGLQAGHSLYDDAGYFYIYTTSASSSRQTILGAIEKHLECARRGEIDDEQVAEAQLGLKGRWLLSMEDNASRASWLARWTPLLDDDQPLPDYPALIDAVTPADLSRVVETYFTPQRSYLARHDPAITVTGSARALGIAAALSASMWLWRKLWRKA